MSQTEARIVLGYRSMNRWQFASLWITSLKVSRTPWRLSKDQDSLALEWPRVHDKDCSLFGACRSLFKLNPRNVGSVTYQISNATHQNDSALVLSSIRLKPPHSPELLGKIWSLQINKSLRKRITIWDLKFEIWQREWSLWKASSLLDSTKQSSLDWMELNGALSEDQVGPSRRRASATGDSEGGCKLCLQLFFPTITIISLSFSFPLDSSVNKPSRNREEDREAVEWWNPINNSNNFTIKAPLNPQIPLLPSQQDGWLPFSLTLVYPLLLTIKNLTIQTIKTLGTLTGYQTTPQDGTEIEILLLQLE